MSEDKTSIKRFIAERVKGSVYHGVQTLEAIAESLGMKISDLCKLNANENAYGAPKVVTDDIQEAMHWVYPDPAQVKLREAIATNHSEFSVKPDNVVAGAGSDDILDILMRLTCPESVVISTPTFGMYSFLSKVAGVTCVDVKRNSDFTVNVDAVVAKIRETKARLVFFPSPNNPTGTVLPNKDVEILLKEDCLVVLDEAYADFCDTTALELFNKYDNLVVCRTFSKWAGLAGLRLGYAIAHKDLVDTMMAIKQPYNVNTASEVAGLAALKHRDEIMKTVVALREEKDRMFLRLKNEISWLKPVPSDANFVLSEVLGGLPAKTVYEKLLEKGVLIRYFGTQGGDLSNYIRISAGKPEDTDRVIDTLKSIGNSYFAVSKELNDYNTQAILLDMDGVLADVTFSQHKAIIDTAALYGVTVTEEDIGECKAKGDANNDWIVTTNLINAKKVSPPAELESVTKQWEEIYQGSDGKRGLWEIETLIMDAELLRNLSKKYPVAIVTGRPRLDAERFLDQHNIADCVKFLVCMGEAKSKPAPDGVKMALEKLGVERALFVGDTPDDVVAGNAAGIKTIGVAPPGATDKLATNDLLRKTGASAIFSVGLHEFAEFL